MKKWLSLLCLVVLVWSMVPAAPAEDLPLPEAEASAPADQETAQDADAADEAEADTPAGLIDDSYFLSPGQERVLTEDMYLSENISIQISAQRYLNTDVYVADIYVRSVSCFQRAYPGKKWNTTAKRITPFSQEVKAILSMTGDSAQNLSKGWVIFNGQIVRNAEKKARQNAKRDLGILYQNGEFVTVLAQDIDNAQIAQQAADGEIWQLFLFGPALLDGEGKAKTKFNSDVGPVNPRSVIGYYEPGHYCFVQVDGRRTESALEKGRKNKGLTLTDLSKFMESLGCAAAYNLDGGQSSVMYFGTKIHSTPYSKGRRLGDIVLIKEVE